MKVLAIDTATDVCGVALAQEEQLVADLRLHQAKLHNEKLISSIRYLLEQAGWALHDIEGIALANGPGSFTGLRIGISVAKGLAYSLDIPLAAVNTLDAFAEPARTWKGQICVVMKVRAAELYLALFAGKGDAVERLSDDRIISVSELSNYLDEHTLVIGHPPRMLKPGDVAPGTLAGVDLAASSPETVARIGGRKLQQGEASDLDNLEPFYLKEFKPKRKDYYAKPVSA